MTKGYGTATHRAVAVAGVTLTIAAGERVAVVGPSGSGKSTLLHIMGALTAPDSGEVWLGGIRLNDQRPRHLARLRNRLVGFVFQHYGLLPDLTVFENVELPLIYGKVRWGRTRRVLAALEAVGLPALARRYPSTLSGGQQQRVAVARALVTEAPVLLADEPTGALDQKTGAEVLEQLCGLSDGSRTLVIVTHSADVAERCQRLIRIVDGRVDVDGEPP